MAVKNREYKTGEGKAGLKNIPFQKRLEPHLDELKWLYMELYDNQPMCEGLCSGSRQLCDDQLLSLPVGSELQESCGV